MTQWQQHQLVAVNDGAHLASMASGRCGQAVQLTCFVPEQLYAVGRPLLDVACNVAVQWLRWSGCQLQRHACKAVRQGKYDHLQQQAWPCSVRVHDAGMGSRAQSHVCTQTVRDACCWLCTTAEACCMAQHGDKPAKHTHRTYYQHSRPQQSHRLTAWPAAAPSHVQHTFQPLCWTQRACMAAPQCLGLSHPCRI